MNFNALVVFLGSYYYKGKKNIMGSMVQWCKLRDLYFNEFYMDMGSQIGKRSLVITVRNGLPLLGGYCGETQPEAVCIFDCKSPGLGETQGIFKVVRRYTKNRSFTEYTVEEMVGTLTKDYEKAAMEAVKLWVKHE